MSILDYGLKTTESCGLEVLVRCPTTGEGLDALLQLQSRPSRKCGGHGGLTATASHWHLYWNWPLFWPILNWKETGAHKNRYCSQAYFKFQQSFKFCACSPLYSDSRVAGHGLAATDTGLINGISITKVIILKVYSLLPTSVQGTPSRGLIWVLACVRSSPESWFSAPESGS